jgi:hypothetical protein
MARASTTSSTSSIKPVRRIYPLAVVVVAIAVASWTAALGGRESAAFLALATIAFGWVVWLLFRAAGALVRDPVAADAAVATGRRRKELEREKAALLKALKELEFDHQMGKVSDKDFVEIGTNYRGRALRVMRQLDDAGHDYEVMVERALAARLKRDDGKSDDARDGKSDDAKSDDARDGKADDAKSDDARDGKADDAHAAGKTNGAAKTAAAARPVCEACGTVNDDDAGFCKKCGAKLAAAEATR